ncbi:MAG TPA: helix-turn-helix transcriptional regulator [Vicinamibacterales bacterium]|jgi:DNA-binding PadR family transcriptional regulator
MRRKPGTLVPLEEWILSAAIELRRRREDFHGYQIAKHIADASDRKLLTAYGTLYRALGRLEAMGLLRSRWEDPQRAADERRPPRRLYSLTDEGLDTARATRRARASAHARTGKRRVAPA